MDCETRHHPHTRMSNHTSSLRALMPGFTDGYAGWFYPVRAAIDLAAALGDTHI